jgi:ribosomal protein S18 acetylase RimI-like enzyme
MAVSANNQGEAASSRHFLHHLQMQSEAIEVRALTPDLLPDFLAYFEGAAFADNPKWKSCYCQFLYVDHAKVEWMKRSGEENRQAACHRIGAATMQGYLAYRNGTVVGWCNAAPRAMMDAFADEPDPQASQLGQITCFVVAREHRRTGVATALLDAACAGLKAQGLRIAEAMPKPEVVGDAENHHGPLSLFTGAGFEFHRQGEHGSVYVRKTLV